MTGDYPETSRPPASTGGSDPAPTVWGLSCLELHDRFWAAQGVQVVRRGNTQIDKRGPRAYLLIDTRDLVLLAMPASVRKLRRGRLRVLRVDLVSAEAPPYSERIVADDSGRLVELKRHYGSPPVSRNPVLITADAAIASTWCGASSLEAAIRKVRLAAGLNRLSETRCPGEKYDASDPSSARRCLTSLMFHWNNPDRVITGISRLRPGVWAHRSAAISPSTRLVPPVWIGSGAVLRARDAVIGPCIVNDEVDVAASPPRPSCWPPLRHYDPGPRARPQHRRPGRLGRRLFDIAFSLFALTLVAPLFPLIMLAIWLEDGRPFFFNHTRQTVGGKNFVCFKFRTMCRDAEKLKSRLAEKNLCDGPQFHIEDDPRLLRTGKFLRRFHLDELPQFINVLMGQMNIIGPRPSPDNENQFCPAWREARLSVRPGLTGLWQVNRTRAPNADFQEWIRYDLDYVDRQSWWLDLWIIYRTTRDIIMPRSSRNGNAPTRRQSHGADDSTEDASNARVAVVTTAPPGSPESDGRTAAPPRPERRNAA